MLCVARTRFTRNGLVTPAFTVQLCPEPNNWASSTRSRKTGAPGFVTSTTLMSEGLHTYSVLLNQATEFATTPLIPGTFVGPTPGSEKLITGLSRSVNGNTVPAPFTAMNPDAL